MESEAREYSRVIATYALSVQQRRLWSQPACASFCAQGAILIEGVMDANALRGSVELVVARHEILRTTFTYQAGSELPLQAVRDYLGIDWEEINVAGWGSEIREAEVSAILRRQSSDGFDLEHGPVLRASLLNIGEQRSLLVLTLPSVCADTLTLKNLTGEIERAYRHLTQGAELTADLLPYSEFSSWQNESEEDEDEDARKVRAYWAMQNLASLAQMNLGKAGADYRPEVYGFDIAPELIASLDSVAERLDISVRAILLACWSILVSRLNNQTHVMIGEIFDGRGYEEFQEAVGLYARCLPVGSRLQPKQRFSSLARQLQELQQRAIERQDYAAFDKEVIFPIGFEYNEWQSQHDGDLSFKLIRQLARLERFQIKLACIRTENHLRAELHFDPEVFDEARICVLQERFLTLLDAVIREPGELLEKLPTLGLKERAEILTVCSGLEVKHEGKQCLHDLFEAQVKRTPDEVAVVSRSQVITYAELNARANQMARYLISRGIGPDVMVGVCVERSIEMIVALLGILKAGGAYIPLDPSYPTERLALMAEDARVPVMITQAGLEGRAGTYDGEILSIDLQWEQINRESREAVESGVSADNVAYVIYTSGSTGKPKGVMIQHRSIYNHMLWMQGELPLFRSDRLLQKTAISFDASVWELFAPLMAGARLIMAEPGGQQDPSYLVEVINQQQVTILQLVPTMLDLLLMEADLSSCKSLRRVYSGGEILTAVLQERFYSQMEAVLGNLYGPTETTVQVIYWECARESTQSSVPIGKPIWNTQSYVLGANMQLIPVREAGELFIGGAGIGRGYLNRPDVTAEKYLPNPFGEAGSRLYRTGDMTRLSANESIELLGRIDNQLKIRGFRVELGEIESELSTHPDVWKAVVVYRKAAQTHQLVGYVIAKQGIEISQAELRAHVAKTLPEYMIPSAIVQLGTFPVMPNGKIDREALPAPDRSDAKPGDQLALPRNAEEKALAEIWAGVLGLPAVGIYDNFFDLGGDSILAIQVVARANRIGLRLTPKQVFDKQIIADLAAVAGTGPQLEAEQGWVTGAVSLIPIQHWFFEQSFVEPHHWNQSILLEAPAALDPGLLETAVLRIIAHHDALRLRFEQSSQHIAGMEKVADSFTVINLTTISEPDLPGAIEEAASQLQSSLNMSEGPMARFALFELGGGRPNRLLIVIHHLAVDGISWRILLEDLETVCDQLLKHEPIDLPPKSSSFKQWSQRLTEHAESGALAEEVQFWSQLESGDYARLPQDGDGPNTVGSTKSITCSLEPEETSILLHELPEAYGTHINDILLTAIARSFAACTGSASLLIDMEGHGREPIFEDVDVSRTVGWFTSKFPVLLDTRGAESSFEALRLVKDQLRKIPNNGIGYGLLRYLSKDQEAIEKLSALPDPYIKFNYLGQFDQTFAKAGLFAVAQEARGAERNSNCARTHLLDIDALVAGGCLHLRWSYSEGVYDHNRISRIAQAAQDELRTLIAQKDTGATDWYAPSDFPLVQLDQQRLDQIANALLANRDNSELEHGRVIEDIYPVSPLQESFLLHSLSSQSSGVGFEQKSVLLQGSIDLNTFGRTWQSLVDRHPVLRTAFVIDSISGPLQVVLRRVQMPIDYQDWREMPLSRQQQKLEEYLRADLERGFDPAIAPLMRVALIRLGEERYQLVWSHHHLLLDAWCGHIVLQEIFEIYNATRSERVPELPQRHPYRDYIAWIQKQDSTPAEQFWRDTLKAFAAPTRLPIGKRVLPGRGQELYKSRLLQFTASETEPISQFAKSNKLTLNTLLQGAWGLLLGRYCETEDVLFGTTVSGRPPELPNSESILGMFINNLPVRVRFSGAGQVLPALRDLQNNLVSMREYEWVSPLRLQEWSELSRGNRLFESLMVFQNFPFERNSQGRVTDLQMGDARGRIETSYPLTLVVGPFDPLTIRFIYDARRFDDSEIARLAEHLKTVLNGLALSSPSQVFRNVPMVTELPNEHTETDTSDAEKLCVHRLIEKKAAGSPNDVAVKCEKGSLTWRELNYRANALARKLTRAGVGAGTVVAVLPNLNLEFAIWLLAVLKTGAGFTVLDSDENISKQLERTGAGAILTTEAFDLKAQKFNVPVIIAEHKEGAAESDRNLRKQLSINHLACLLYNPGSERPVEITHEAIFNQASNFARIANPANQDAAFIGTTSVASAALEILECLAAGVPIVLADDKTLLQPEALTEALRDSGATIMQAPTVVWQQLLNHGWQGRPDFKAICSGKRIPDWLCRELSARTGSLLKVYTVGSVGRWLAYCRIQGTGHDDSVLIGSAVAGTRLKLLSRDLQPVPVGVTGEIYISSDDLDWGNICDGEAVPDQFARLFRTGDLGRRRDDGRIEYRGRAGRRIAIKGDLVDLFEVETELMAHPALFDVAVTLWENAEGEPWLGAYIVADFKAMPGTEELVGFANTRLPRYAIPDFFIAMDSLPLTSEGEVNFAALPPPDAEGIHVEVVWQEFCDPLQLRLKKIWEDLFGIRPIGIKENFFELGGYSLLGVRLMSEIRKQFNRDLPLSTLLRGATIEYLAEVLRSEDEQESWSPMVPIQEGGDRLPLFCVHSLGGEVLNYLELAHYLGSDQPVYGVQARVFADGKEGSRRLEDMAAYYVEAIRKVQPHGPYCLIGYSFGGVVALEIAQQLYSAGERFVSVGPLDTDLTDNLPLGPGFDPEAPEQALDWSRLILNFARHGTEVSVDDLKRAGSLEEQVAYAIEHGVLPYNLDLETAMRYIRSGDVNSEAKSRYVAKPFHGQIHLFRALQGRVLECPDPTLGWGDVAAGGLDIEDVPGAHWNMMVKPHAQALANKVRPWLDRAQAQHSVTKYNAAASEESLSRAE